MMLKGRALVTGGAGFLGAHMCERMLDEGFEVLCLDNFLTGSLKNISRLSEQLRFNYANTDISTPFNVEGPVSLVIHLASPASPVHYQKHPIQTLMVGSIGTYHALEVARCNSATFLLASSSEAGQLSCRAFTELTAITTRISIMSDARVWEIILSMARLLLGGKCRQFTFTA